VAFVDRSAIDLYAVHERRSRPRAPVAAGRGISSSTRDVGAWGLPICQESTMSKRARKRRARKGKGANHGRRPNA